MMSLKTKVNTDGLTVLKATYGITNAMQDVTTDIKGLIKDGELNFNVNPQSIGILDPAPGVKKTFQLQYKVNGGNASLLTKDDGEQVVLSVPDAVSVKNSEADAAKAPTFIGMTFHFITILITTIFTLSSYYVGSVMFGSQVLGIVFACFSALTGGMFGLFVLPFIVLFFFLFNPTFTAN